MIKIPTLVPPILLLLFILCNDVPSQTIGPITKIQIDNSSMIIAADTNVVVFKACTDHILMINYRPNGHHDPDTLVVTAASWTSFGVSIDTSGDPLRFTTANYMLEISRSPMRFHLYKNGGQLLCEEPAEGGIKQHSVQLNTSGGPFYGVHNRSAGLLQTQNTNQISAGNQGQAGGPFAWTTKGWGFLADADGGSITCGGSSFAFQRHASAIKRDLEFYFLVGTPNEIIKGLHSISGAPPLFPKYTFGFLNTEWGIDQAELYSNIRTYKEKSIPLSAYVLDFDWMDWGSDNYGEFRWGPKFPDGASGSIVDTLNRYGVHLMGIRKPRVHTGTTQGAYCLQNNFFVDYVTDYFSGKQVGRLNFHLPAARQWFWESFGVQENSYAKGITGYWNDEADEYGGNLMFMQMQRAMYEGQRSLNNNRVWSINRNFYTGAQRYAYALWSGDIGSGFVSMAAQRLFMLSSITLGVSWWGMDIGGFSGTPNAENYFRWIQFGAFVPVFRVHGSLNQEREPWNFGTEAEEIAAKYIRLRYRLMPYIYAAARTNHETGLPLVRPLVMDFPDDPSVTDLTSEWMFGNSLLVSPVVEEYTVNQSVYLPEGSWFDFHSGKYYSGNANYTIPVTREDIPIFVKGGALIPMSSSYQPLDVQRSVTLSSFPGGTGQCVVYHDDGITYEYEDGTFAVDSIMHDRSEQRAIITIGSRKGKYTLPAFDWTAEFNWAAGNPDSVILDAVHLPALTIDSLQFFGARGWAYDAQSKKCYARFGANGSSHTLTVYLKNVNSAEMPLNSIPRQFSLEQNFPNPFNPTTAIRYALPVSGHIKITVHDLLGRETATLVDENQSAGWKEISWNAAKFSSGVYYYKIQSGHFVAIKKMIVLK